MDTSMIDRWEDYQNMSDRARFEQHLDGLLAIQQVQALRHLNQDTAAVWMELEDEVAGVFAATEINAAVLLENGAEEA